MAELKLRSSVEAKVQFTITEAEARALDALAGYGDDAFIKVFYEKLGAAYMRDHERGLRSFLKSIRAEMGPILNRADLARRAFLTRDPNEVRHALDLAAEHVRRG